jgi:hypothetical protein
MPDKEDFVRALKDQLFMAQSKGLPWVEINSGELHRFVGGYPAKKHQMPVCCAAMYAEQRATDETKSAPPKRNGASVTIRYNLPR